MKVNGVNPNKVINLYAIKNKNNIQSKNKVENGDKLEISEIGKSLSYLSDLDKLIPNDKKVETIKQQIQEGKYKVDEKKLAEELMKYISGKEI